MPTLLMKFTPMVEMPAPVVVASNESMEVPENSSGNPVPTLVTSNGTPDPSAILGIATTPTHGTVTLVDNLLIYTPTPNFAGFDSFTYTGTSGGVTSSPATISITVDAVAPCQELGRTTRNYVSGYTLSRQAVTRVRRQAKRCVIANFNGALPAGRTIVSARWETTSPWSVYMSNPRIAHGQRETMIDISFNFAGWGGVLCTVTLDNGELYNAEFSFTVIDSPLYPSATYDTNNGPYRLDVSI